MARTSPRTPKPRTGNNTGRPPFEIDYKKVKSMAEIGCTQLEIATVLGCSPKTLSGDERFLRIYNAGLSHVKMSLRRAQLRSAVQGRNVSAQIWLGKQMLGQRDTPKDDDDDPTKAAPTQVTIVHRDGRKPKPGAASGTGIDSLLND